MILALLTLQIRRHEHFRDLNVVIFVGIISTLLFYAINMNDVNLFADSSFLFLATLNVYYIKRKLHLPPLKLY